jgi:two-component system cell cycle sensor histidine kinase/response regulator CckA
MTLQESHVNPIEILLVEDNPEDARRCQGLLKETRLETGDIVHVESLQEALRRLADRSFGVVLLDLKLPDADGLQALQAIRRESPATPVVILTDRADEETAVRAVHAGAQDYLVEGQIDADDLRRSIRYAIEREKRRIAEAALRDCEERLRAFVANAPVVLFGADLAGRITRMEGKAVESLGLGPDRGIGRSVAEVFGPVIPDAEVWFRRALGGEAEHGSFLVQGRTFEVHFVRQFDDFGDVAGVIAVGTDVTDRVRAEKRFMKALHHSPFTLVISTLAEGRFVDVNEAFAQALGYKRDEMIGRTALEIRMWVNPEERHRFVKMALEKGVAMEVPTTFRTKAGEPRSFVASAEPFVMDGGLCLIGSIRDVTEVKELQRKLDESERKVSMGEFASFVAHQLKTPLTNISLLASSIRRSTREESTQERVAKIDAQRRVAGQIIDDLLTFSRHRELHPVDVDVRSLVDRACVQVEPYRRSAVSLVKVLPTHPVKACVDPLKVQETLVNLLRNAFEATERGNVTVVLTESDGFIDFAISDTGGGIPPENLPRLFEPFFTTKTGMHGTGLGLPLCRTIAEAHVGRVDVASVPGKGSTFTLRLPVAVPAS